MTLAGQVFDFSVNDSSLLGLIQKINSFTDVGFGGIIGIVLLILIGGMLFMIMKSYGNERALSVSLLVTSVIGMMLRLLSLIENTVFYICLVLLVISIIMLIKETEKYE